MVKLFLKLNPRFILAIAVRSLFIVTSLDNLTSLAAPSSSFVSWQPMGTRRRKREFRSYAFLYVVFIWRIKIAHFYLQSMLLWLILLSSTHGVDRCDCRMQNIFKIGKTYKNYKQPRIQQYEFRTYWGTLLQGRRSHNSISYIFVPRKMIFFNFLISLLTRWCHAGQRHNAT